MSWIKLPVSFLGVFFATSLLAQMDLSLSDAIEIGLRNNYEIQIVDKQQEVARVNNSFGAAGRYPSVDLNFNGANLKEYNDSRDLLNQSLVASVDLSWLLFNGFSVRIRKEKLEDLYQLSQGNSMVVVENTIQQIILSYYRVLLEREKLSVAERIMKLSHDRYKKTLVGKELGSVVTFELLQAQNAWLDDKSAFLLQKVDFNNSVRDLNFLLGQKEDVTYGFTQKFEPDVKDYPLAELQKELLERNSNLKNRYLHEALLNKEVVLARRNYQPRVYFGAGIQGKSVRNKFSGESATSQDSYNVYANVNMTFSLFDGGVKKRALQIAKIEEEIGKVETEDLRHTLTNQLSQYYELYQVRRELYHLAVENLEAAELNLRVSSEKYLAGSINSFNYRDVQIIYQNAALGRLYAIFDLIVSETALLRLTGGILTQ